MQTIEAIYQDGVFKPLGDLHLSENERVVLTIEENAVPEKSKAAALAWIKRMTEAQERFVAERGYLTGVTEDIAADRMRDV